MRPPLLLGLLLLASLGAADVTYPVRQFRPARVGDVFDLDVTATRHRHVEMAVHGRPPAVADDDRSVHLVGRCTVVAVDGHGAPTTFRCRVDQLVATTGGRPPSPLLPAGAEIEATQSGDGPRYRRTDGPMPDGVAGPLAVVLVPYPADRPTADDVFPPGRPRAVGESWPIDPARAPAPADAHVAGHATLVGLATLAGRPALRVSHVSDVDGPVPVPAQPPGVRSAHRNALSESTATLPVDPADAASDVVTRDTVDHDLHGATDAGAAFTEQAHVVTDTHAVRTPVPR